MKDVYITKVASYLPNNPIENDQMESFIGFIGGKPSRVRSIVLRQNGIKTRYYGIDKSQKMTHTNALLAKNAVCNLFDDNKIPEDVFLLSCATSSPDQLLPSHASMTRRATESSYGNLFKFRGVSYFTTSFEDLL